MHEHTLCIHGTVDRKQRTAAINNEFCFDLFFMWRAVNDETKAEKEKNKNMCPLTLVSEKGKYSICQTMGMNSERDERILDNWLV